jgi:hypothetical protein
VSTNEAGNADLQRKLTEVAKGVRDWFEGGTHFIGFPRMACNAASYLLATYMTEECGIEGVELIANGERRHLKKGRKKRHEKQSHCWLECSGFIIDITADQFGDGMHRSS